MSGRCYACGDAFKKIFSGEKGCKNCGFEFCKKCISKKIAVPKLKNEQHHVCDKCYKLLSTGKTITKQRPPSPPKVHVKRMQALERGTTSTAKGKGIAAPSMVSTSSGSQNKYVGMDPVDADLQRRYDKLKEEREKNVQRPDTKEIETRLASLKAGKPEPPSETEMRDRLAQLQGKPQASQQKHQFFPPERRSEEEQIVDLMDELFDEHQIEQRHEGILPEQTSTMKVPPTTNESNCNDTDLQEIHALIQKSAKELQLDAENALLSLQQDEKLMAKLKELKKKPNDEGKDTTDSVDIHTMDDADDENADSDDFVAEKLIKQYLEEAKLDEAAARASAGSGITTVQENLPAGSIPEVYQPQPKDDEFPWCCICNDDAKIRCFDCDEDLYCAQCFGEGHKDAHMKDHDFERYPKRN